MLRPWTLGARSCAPTIPPCERAGGQAIASASSGIMSAAHAFNEHVAGAFSWRSLIVPFPGLAVQAPSRCSEEPRASVVYRMRHGQAAVKSPLRREGESRTRTRSPMQKLHGAPSPFRSIVSFPLSGLPKVQLALRSSPRTARDRSEIW